MSDGQDRRSFLKTSAAAASALAVGCGPRDDGVAGPATSQPLPPRTLRAAAEIALPSELEPAGRERIVAGFEAWLADYAPVAEQVHGYGSQEISYGPPHPGPAWRAQLEALDLESRTRHGADFADIGTDERRRLLEAALADAPDGLPDRPGALGAGHVVSGLLGYFYGAPEATDLCYGREIRGLSCRPLSSSGAEPRRLPLASASRTIGTDTPAPDADAARARGRPTLASARIEAGLEPGS